MYVGSVLDYRTRVVSADPVESVHVHGGVYAERYFSYVIKVVRVVRMHQAWGRGHINRV